MEVCSWLSRLNFIFDNPQQGQLNYLNLHQCHMLNALVVPAVVTNMLVTFYRNYAANSEIFKEFLKTFRCSSLFFAVSLMLRQLFIKLNQNSQVTRKVYFNVFSTSYTLQLIVSERFFSIHGFQLRISSLLSTSTARSWCPRIHFLWQSSIPLDTHGMGTSWIKWIGTSRRLKVILPALSPQRRWLSTH